MPDLHAKENQTHGQLLSLSPYTSENPLTLHVHFLLEKNKEFFKKKKTNRSLV